MDTPNHDVPELKLEDYLPKDLIRNKQANLPNVSEPEVVRHYIKLSSKKGSILLPPAVIFPTLITFAGIFLETKKLKL